jgi:radical SAM superfamily enzyme YgiQ (UPF0313 family)
LLLKNKTFGVVNFGGGEQTLGLDVVSKHLFRKYGIITQRADTKTAKNFDVLLVSLFWWENVYDYIRFLIQAKIDPGKRSPLLVLGGMATVNYKIFKQFAHYVVLGDGEVGVDGLIESDDKSPFVIDLTEKNIENKELATSPSLSSERYEDLRNSKQTRIEISRGCKYACPFCLLSFMKPYRELPTAIIKRLVLDAETNNIALFAADRASHSGFLELNDFIDRQGKNNTGNDLRLDSIYRKEIKTINRLRFGLEGFSERMRRANKKLWQTDKIIESFRYIFDEMKTSTGKPISNATCYLIADLPGERTEEDLIEFNELLKTVNDILAKANRKFTLFISVSSFAPYFITPLQWAGINPYSDFNDAVTKHIGHHSHLIKAFRGLLISPSKRLAQMLTIRGDERAIPILYKIAINKSKVFSNSSKAMGRELEGLLVENGIERDALSRELDCSSPIIAGINQPDLRGSWHTYRGRAGMPALSVDFNGSCCQNSADRD